MTREVEEFSAAVLRELNLPGDIDPTIAAAIVSRVVVEEYVNYRRLWLSATLPKAWPSTYTWHQQSAGRTGGCCNTGSRRKSSDVAH